MYFKVVSKGEGSKLLNPRISNLHRTNAYPKNIVVENFRERGSSKTQQHKTQQGDHSLGSQRPKENIVKPIRYRHKIFVGTCTHIFARLIDDRKSSSLKKERGVGKELLRVSPRYGSKLRLNSSVTCLG